MDIFKSVTHTHAFSQNCSFTLSMDNIRKNKDQNSLIFAILFQFITPEFIKNAEFEVDICGTLYPAQCRLNPPVLPKKVSYIAQHVSFVVQDNNRCHNQP